MWYLFCQSKPMVFKVMKNWDFETQGFDFLFVLFATSGLSWPIQLSSTHHQLLSWRPRIGVSIIYLFVHPSTHAKLSNSIHRHAKHRNSTESHSNIVNTRYWLWLVNSAISNPASNSVRVQLLLNSAQSSSTEMVFIIKFWPPTHPVKLS